MARKKLGEMLVEAGVLSEQNLRMALNEQRRWGGTLGRILIDMKMLGETELVSTLSKQLALPAIDLDSIDIHQTVLDLVPGEFAEQHGIVPFAQPMKFLDVAMADPTNLGIADELRIRTQLNIRPHLAGPKMIERALAKHYRRGFGRQLARRDVDIQIDVAGDEISMGSSSLGFPGAAARTRPMTEEIDAARLREGLPRAPRQTRQQGLDVHTPMAGTPTVKTDPLGPPGIGARDAEIDALQTRISKLEALVERDEQILRKVLALLVEKDVATREEILERIRG